MEYEVFTYKAIFGESLAHDGVHAQWQTFDEFRAKTHDVVGIWKFYEMACKIQNHIFLLLWHCVST